MTARPGSWLTELMDPFNSLGTMESSARLQRQVTDWWLHAVGLSAAAEEGRQMVNAPGSRRKPRTHRGIDEYLVRFDYRFESSPEESAEQAADLTEPEPRRQM